MAKIVIEISKEIEDLIPMFLKTVNQNIATIKTAIAANDIETVRTLGHRMKGSGGGYGFAKVTELGKAIEDGAKSQNLESCSQANDQLADYMANIEVVFVDRPL